MKGKTLKKYVCLPSFEYETISGVLFEVRCHDGGYPEDRG